MQAYKMVHDKPAPKNSPIEYLQYSKFCAVSAVTGGPVEEMNGIPIPAQLIYGVGLTEINDSCTEPNSIAHLCSNF